MKIQTILAAILIAGGAQAQTNTNPTRAGIISECIQGFYQEVAALESKYPELKGISRITPGANSLFFANGTIKGPKTELATYSHRNACLISLSIHDRKGITADTSPQLQRVDEKAEIGESWTIIVNPEGERAGELHTVVGKAKYRWMTRLSEALQALEAAQPGVAPPPGGP